MFTIYSSDKFYIGLISAIAANKNHCRWYQSWLFMTWHSFRTFHGGDHCIIGYIHPDVYGTFLHCIFKEKKTFDDMKLNGLRLVFADFPSLSHMFQSTYHQLTFQIALDTFPSLSFVGAIKFEIYSLYYSFQLFMGLISIVSFIGIEVSRLAIACPCLFRIMILCHSPRPKSGWKLGYV